MRSEEAVSSEQLIYATRLSKDLLFKHLAVKRLVTAVGFVKFLMWSLLMGLWTLPFEVGWF